ncbi:hypothetical protein [Microbulbifer magnicolonia]|uniref:hypothetical protein n=1 Tax=Microbulbifer magnicolonia TaxID=3109744 RepID=UPI002B4082F4|nr:hypothetical protein [Microbulbifer sp. GG15]
MTLKMYAGSRWIIVRLLLHVTFILPVMYLWYVVVGSKLYTGIFFVGLLMAYVALIHAQFKKPLFALYDNFLEVNNFFYTGSKKISLNKIRSIEMGKKYIVLHADSERIVINLFGIPSEKVKKFMSDLRGVVEGGLDINIADNQ